MDEVMDLVIGGQPHVTLTAAARRLCVDYQAILARVRRGDIQSSRFDGHYYVPVVEVERLERDGLPGRGRGHKPGVPLTPAQRAQLEHAQQRAWASNRGRPRLRDAKGRYISAKPKP